MRPPAPLLDAGRVVRALRLWFLVFLSVFSFWFSLVFLSSLHAACRSYLLLYFLFSRKEEREREVFFAVFYLVSLLYPPARRSPASTTHIYIFVHTPMQPPRIAPHAQHQTHTTFLRPHELVAPTLARSLARPPPRAEYNRILNTRVRTYPRLLPLLLLPSPSTTAPPPPVESILFTTCCCPRMYRDAVRLIFEPHVAVVLVS